MTWAQRTFRLSLVGVILFLAPACGRLYFGQLSDALQEQAQQRIARVVAPPHTLEVTSSPSNGRLFWSHDGENFLPMTIGNGRTPFSYTSKNWAPGFWLQVQAENYEPSSTQRVVLNKDIKLHIELKEK